MPAKPTTVQVLLLSGRTGVGRRGQVVDYPADQVAEHLARGVIRLLNDLAPSADARPAAGPLTPVAAELPLADPSEPIAGTDGDEDTPEDDTTDVYEKKPLKQKRRR